ncbi:MAG: hypothetical protein Q9183_006198, partial [Haloplaca sp. 2 TL-2023]
MESSFIPDQLNIAKRQNGEMHDVSPPESLAGQNGIQNNNHRSSPDVSPITETSNPIVGRPQFSGKPSSGIPVLKKTQGFGGAGKMWSNWRAKGAENRTPDASSLTPTGTRWDDYSGERTTSEKGKPGQVTPGSVPFDPKLAPVRNSPNFGMTTTISAGSTPPVRRKRVPSREENFTPAVREEWKGASGRHKIINPLMDKPLPPGKSANFPAGKQRLSQSPTEMTRGRDAISPTAGLGLSPLSGESTPTQETHQRPSITVDTNNHVEPPSSTEVTSPPNDTATIMEDSKPSPKPSIVPEDTRSPLARHPSTEALKMVPQPPTPDATPIHSRDSQESN